MGSFGGNLNQYTTMNFSLGWDMFEFKIFCCFEQCILIIVELCIVSHQIVLDVSDI